MPGLHLNHHVSWDDLLELCYVYDDPGIKLPICECGRIRACDKKVQHQIKNRKYLDDKICTAADCKIVGEKLFRKTEKKKLQIPGNLWCLDYNNDKPKVAHFVKKFAAAIKEFAETERKKIKERNVFEPKEDLRKYCDDVQKKLEETLKEDERGHSCDWWSCSCKLFSLLIEHGDSKTLLTMPNEKIEEVLLCQHGGQAVGNNFSFLTYYVFHVYLYTNLIIASNLQDKPDQWGSMKPGKYFRQSLMHDCDGQTFLFGCRKYLTDEVYMKDFDAMKELCKKCFQLFYFLEMLGNEIEKYKITDSLFN